MKVKFSDVNSTIKTTELRKLLLCKNSISLVFVDIRVEVIYFGRE